MENKARIVNILLDKYVLETENGECIEAIIRKNAIIFHKSAMCYIMSKVLTNYSIFYN